MEEVIAYIVQNNESDVMTNATLHHMVGQTDSQPSVSVPFARPAITPNEMTQHVSSSARERARSRDPLDDIMQLATEEHIAARTTSIHEEVAVYLGMKHSGLKVSEFWEVNRALLPRLYEIAVRVMATIPSSSAAERQFSCSRRIQGLRRVHMNTDFFEDQVMLLANPDITASLFEDEMLRCEEQGTND